MKPISLEEMSAIKLMNRVDTKFIANFDLLPDILTLANNHGYFVQVINDKRVANYDTLYYDTPALDMFTMHHNRHLCRQKIRVRKYVGSNLTFLEIKNKTNTGRTNKKRRQIAEGPFPENLINAHELSPEIVQFVAEKSLFPVDTLCPQLHTIFERITLVNKAKTERLTIDFHLKWINEETGSQMSFEKLMIIELKQDGLGNSDMKNILMSLRIHPTKMSKYCIGVSLTNAKAKHNRFKQKIRKIEKLTK